MGLLSPWFLAGLAALALPVWFHLLRRHKSEPRPFSSLMFFERRTQSSIRHRRLRYLLLFALRAALFAALALAFAAPYFMSRVTGSMGGERLVVLAIDDSASMRARDRLSRAKQEALRATERLRAGDKAQVLTFAGGVTMLSDPTPDVAVLRAAIESVQAKDARNAYADFVRALKSIAQSSRVPVEAHLFSDLQKSALPSGFGDLSLPLGVSLTVHAPGDGPKGNWAVENVTAPTRLGGAGAGRIQATIAGYGTEPATKTVSLVMNGKVHESRRVEIPANGRGAVEFTISDAPRGWSRLEIRLDDGDEYAPDDRYRFAMERHELSRILFLHESRDTRSPLYFRTALEACTEALFAVDVRTVQQAGNVNPAEYAFVVLSNVGLLPEPFEKALVKFIEGGGAAMIVVGPVAAAAPQLAGFEGRATSSRYSAKEGGRFQMVSWVDESHPSVRRANKWAGVKFYQSILVESEDARVVARLADQTPVLLESRRKAGRVLLFASTLDNVANDFPLHASFVPFVEQTARYLSRIGERPSMLTVGAYLELRHGDERGAAVEVLDPDGRRVLGLSEAAVVEGITLDREGYFDVRRPGGNFVVAVNTDRRESDFTPIEEETLKLWQTTSQAESESGTPYTETEAQPRSFWWPLLAVALALAAVESIVAGRHLKVGREAA